MRKTLFGIGVLTAFSTMLGFVPQAVNAQIGPNQVVICSGRGVQATFGFKLNGKGTSLKLRDCATFSGSSTFLLYTEYGRNPRYILERQLSGGSRYEIKLTGGRYEVVPVSFIRD
jgi:hypothetical protein